MYHKTASNVTNNLYEFLTAHQITAGRMVVGVSGGVDSLVLLHALSSLNQLAETFDFSLHVASLDHGLRGAASAEDLAFVARAAEGLGLPVTTQHIDVAQYAHDTALNIEEAARQIRYHFLLDVARQIDANYIAVGHNQDDQAETVMMHLIRGSGLAGLRGMLPVTAIDEFYFEDDFTEIDDVYLIRPLIMTPRSQIEDYAAEHHITPRFDASNDDLKRFRNIMRHDIIPRLEALNPNIKQSLSRLANVIQAEVEVLEGRLESVAAWLLEWDETRPAQTETSGGEVVYIDRDAFREQPLAIQRGLIRKAVFDLSPDTRDLSFDQTEQARIVILEGSTGACLHLPGGLYLQVGYDEVMIGYGGAPLYPENLPSLEEGQYVALDLEGQGYIKGNQRLITYWVVEGLSKDLYPADPLECTLAIPPEAKLALRTRQAGDRFQPFGLGGRSQKLSDTFTNLKVPAYYRDQVPLLMVNDQIAWFVVPTAEGPVGRIAEPFAVKPDSEAILRVRWQIEPNPNTIDTA